MSDINKDIQNLIKDAWTTVSVIKKNPTVGDAMEYAANSIINYFISKKENKYDEGIVTGGESGSINNRMTIDIDTSIAICMGDKVEFRIIKSENFKYDYINPLLGGIVDDSTYEQIEQALDKILAPARKDGKWLSVVERIKCLPIQNDREDEAMLEDPNFG